MSQGTYFRVMGWWEHQGFCQAMARQKGAGQTDKISTLNNATSVLLESSAKFCWCLFPKRCRISLVVVWDGFGFAKEHLGPGGHSSAAAPDGYFQPSSESVWEPVTAFR